MPVFVNPRVGGFLCLALGSALWVAAVSPAYGDCGHWSVPVPVIIDQADQIKVTGIFAQSGNTLTGAAWYITKSLQKGKDVQVMGKLDGGSISGNQITFRVQWDAHYSICQGPSGGCEPAYWGATVLYQGQIASDGQVHGAIFNLNDPGQAKIAWVMRYPLRCTPMSHIEPLPGGVGLLSGSCKPGFVWREAGTDDRVCVPPESRTLAAQENSTAGSRLNPSGADGPNSCIAGFVWREAFAGDHVCVTPERRTAVRDENRVGPSRTQ